MAIPTTRAQFKEYCLRKLGKPVIEINVDDDQVEDRIDEALSYYWDFHYDGTEKIYLKHQVTEQDKANGYITVPENIIGVINLFPVSPNALSSGMFSAQYQFVLNHIHEVARYDLVNFYMTMQHIQYMEKMFVGMQPLRYNRHRNQLFIDTDWNRIETGNYLVAECYQIVDPTLYSDVWKDRWLQNYTTAKIKMQWGSNMTKFIGMNLPGNVQFNGEFIYNEAKEEIAKMEEEMINTMSMPLHDMIG